jgi:ABC-type polysaccharide/polyol phosphate export permease
LQRLQKIGIVRLRALLRIPGSLFLQNLVERRGLLYQLVRRDFEQRFIGSIIGWIWSLIHPLVLLLSWWFAFSVVLKVKLGVQEVTQNYPLWLFAGMLPWLLFSETVQRCSSSLLEQANLITKTVFPAEIVPVSVFLSSLVSHLMALTLMVGAVVLFEGTMNPALVLLPVYMFLTGLLAVGLCWIMASLQVYLRDTSQVLSVVLTFWFWFTPIFIDEGQFPARIRFLISGNPISYLVRAYRELLLSRHLPSGTDLVIVGAYAVTAFVAGGLFFRHMKRGFADVL